MSEASFVKAASDNLPVVDIFMVAEYLKSDDRFTAAEIRGVKAGRAARESYGDNAVGYVEIKRENRLCTVRGKVCPEHNVRKKPYSVSFIVNENEEKVLHVECHDCAASLGGCKHALAFLMWVHRRSEEPAPTDVVCYWKKPRMAGIGSTIKSITAKNISKVRTNSKLTCNTSFLQGLIEIGKQNNIDGQISKHNFELPSDQLLVLSMHTQLHLFNEAGGGSPEDFLSYLKANISLNLCKDAERQTRIQYISPLWYELRYGRVTASKLYEVAHCKTVSGVLVESLIGASKIHNTRAMERGRLLEKKVLDVVSSKLNRKCEECGLFIMQQNPIFAASPDAITEDFVIEVKCPNSKNAVKAYIKNGLITKKCNAQIQLQILATNKKKGLFCVAAEDFEFSKNVKMKWIDFEEEFLENLLKKAFEFWKENLFQRLYTPVNI